MRTRILLRRTSSTQYTTSPKRKNRTARKEWFCFLVEVAGKRGIKQLIIVFDDAPEQNKELKERGTSDAQRLCLRAVGELAASLVAGFSAELNILALAAVAGFSRAANISTPCALKASFQNFGWDMRTRILLRRTSSTQYTTSPKRKNRTARKEWFCFLVEVAGLELAASSTRNWRATNCATPR